MNDVFLLIYKIVNVAIVAAIIGVVLFVAFTVAHLLITTLGWLWFIGCTIAFVMFLIWFMVFIDNHQQ